MKKIAVTFVIILVSLLTCVGAVSANLVANGGFESPVGQAQTFDLMFNGLTNWDIKPGGSIDLITGYWTPHGGNQSIDLAGHSPAKISQKIKTVVGGNYSLSFWMAGNPDLQGVKELGVYWDGVLLNPTYKFDTTGKSYHNMGWEFNSIPNLVATKETTEIAFAHISPYGPYGVALDGISVEEGSIPITPITPVPEFPGFALPTAFLIGFMGTILFVKKSREK
jgi:choice-of-anchor C domain-containing protein